MPDQLPHIESYLLQRIAAGDERSFAALFHAHRNALYSFIVRISGSAEQAEDVVQDVFLKIWTARAELPGIHDFHAYVFRMSHNHCLNLLQRKAKEAKIISSFLLSSATVDEEVLYRETERQVQHAIDELPTQQRLVFTMSRQMGLSQQEISKQLHITVPTVKSHMTQALRFLRNRCKDMVPLAKSFLFFL